jgi:uncharacterized protein with NRDE domain
MCLVAIALDQSRQFPLVIAANRDEFHERPTARLAWWRADAHGPEILGGRDQQGGGTWLGLAGNGRLALLTNIRDGRVPPDPAAPSRGGIVPLWLGDSLPPDEFWMRVALSGHNPFNLIAMDFAAGDCWWAASNLATPRRLGKGLYGLSNAALDTPWPKVERLKAEMAGAIDRHGQVAPLADALLRALGDRSLAHDDDLPETGVPIDLERQLSAAFIRMPDRRYGTRSSTLVITERVGRHLVTHVIERSYTAGPGVALMRRATLRDWPPRYTQGLEPTWSAGQAPVSEGDAAHAAHAAHAADEAGEAPRLVRPRARSLLKPAKKRH